MIYDVAVIGAGLSGLAAARRLMQEGRSVVVVEKSRGLGGRAATRRLTSGSGIEVPVDHGAQFFTARDIRFVEQVSRWEEEGVCFPWCEGFMTWKEGALHDPNPEWKENRYACRGGMTQLALSLAVGMEVMCDFEASSVSLTQGHWEIRNFRADHADPHLSSSAVHARELIVSAPLPQAVKLIGAHLSSHQHDLIGRIHYGSCIAVMARYPDVIAPPAWQGVQARDPDGKISWMAWDSSKRVRGASSVSAAFAVIHGSKTFSSRWLDVSKEELRVAGEELLREASVIGGSWMSEPLEFLVHRWRYAQPDGPNAVGGFLRAPSEIPLYVIGDGLNGGRIEGAWLSGVFAAEDLLMHRGDSYQSPV